MAHSADQNQTVRPDSENRSVEGDEAPASGAVQVASGILLSRLFGFVRDATLAYFFGAGPHADVFRTALRGPNVLQNLLGEQTLSASFIPIYSRWVEEGREEAGRFAGAIFGLLVVTAAAMSLLGGSFCAAHRGPAGSRLPGRCDQSRRR